MDFLEIIRNSNTYEINIVISKDLNKPVSDYEILQQAYRMIGRELIRKSDSSYWNLD